MAKFRIKKILFPLAALAAGSLALALLLEFGLKFFPVNEGLASMPVGEADPVLRFRPNRTSIWSKDWNFSIVNRVHSNNHGFICDFDYEPDASTPLLAIVGDSYVEAAMVPFGETVTGRLAARAGESGRVYAFASSGSPLSQYLVYAEYARDRFRPAGLAVVIVGNDFDESLLSEGSPDGYHYFRPGAAGRLELVRKDLHYGPARRLLRRSDLVMYALVNLNIASLPSHLFGPRDRYAGNTRRSADPDRVAGSESVVDAFLERLPESAGLPPENILLILDGVRPDLYHRGARESGRESYWGVMRRAVMERAASRGFELLDMEPVFRLRYDRNRRRFEFPTDGHWNGYAHGLVAEEVAASRVWDRVFGETRGP